MIQPVRHETPIQVPAMRLVRAKSPSVRLHAKVSLLLHLETVLGRRLIQGGHPALELTGKLHIPELRAEISFLGHSVADGARKEEHRAAAAIVVGDFAVPIPLQYLALPTRRNSDLWALTPSPEHDPPWIEHYAGQLEGDAFAFDRHIPVDAILDVTFTPGECQDGRGIRVDVAGELRFDRAMHMRLLFRDPLQSTAPPSEADSDEALLIPAGYRIPIARQTVSHLAGPDPRMTVRVVEAGGRIVCAERTLDSPSRDTS